jgi:formamidopyrimidine-DNA glycosylase
MRIAAVEVLDRKIFDGPGDAIRQDVVDHQISRVTRRGKVLILFHREPGKGQTAIAGIGNIYADETTVAGRATNYCPHCQQR